MTEDDERNLGERMERLELQQARMAADVAEIKDALLGTLHGGGGMARQVERNELRLAGLEQWRNKHESEAALLVKEFKSDIDELQRQNSERAAQERVWKWIAAAGGSALLWKIVELAMRLGQ